MKTLDDLGLTPEEEKEILLELKAKHDQEMSLDEKKEFDNYLTEKFTKK